MRISKLFGKTIKSVSGDEKSINAQLLIKGGFISKQISGIYNYLPLGLKTLKKIENIIREEIDAIGGNEILMPAITQEESYEKTGRANMDMLFKFLGHGATKLVLNPTHEEVVTPLVQKFVFSYADLPVAVYQIQNKFRNEPRAKSGLLRGREFSMKDLYSFHADEKDLDTYYEIAKDTYLRIFDRLGIGDGKTVLTYASGSSFCRFSHEFQTLSEMGEDEVYLCEKCNIAINKEIIDTQNNCPICNSKKLIKKNGIEVGNIFKLKTKFTDAFDFKYTDENGKIKPVLMGCYGMGPSRLMGAIVEIFHDKKGIIWPKTIAPYKIHLSYLGNNSETISQTEKLYTELNYEKIETLFDDRQKPSAGEKLGDADLIGLPFRIVLSDKTLSQNAVEFKARNSENTQIIPINKIIKELDELK